MVVGAGEVSGLRIRQSTLEDVDTDDADAEDSTSKITFVYIEKCIE